LAARSRAEGPFSEAGRGGDDRSMNDTATKATDRNTTAWMDVRDSCERLAMKLNYHLEQVGTKERADAEDAVRRIASLIDDAVDGIRLASTDPAIRDDLRSVGSTLSTAVTTSLNQAGDGLKRVLDGNRRIRKHDEP
jgi:hypothetical protein